MVNHHPAPELLIAYSAGSLPLSHAMAVSTHVEYCSECQTQLKRLNSIGAGMFEQLQRCDGSTQLKDKVMSLLDDKLMPEPEYAGSESIPKALRQFIPKDYSGLDWSRVSPSIQTADLYTDINGSRVSLIKIRPGGKVGAHGHTGDELTQVLDGSFSDETGLYSTGDFVLRNSNDKHKIQATEDGECLCLTVIDAPIEFTGFFSRLFNPLIRRKYFAT